jgi:hypothetical protein
MPPLQQTEEIEGDAGSHRTSRLVPIVRCGGGSSFKTSLHFFLLTLYIANSDKRSARTHVVSAVVVRAIRLSQLLVTKKR